MPAHFFIIRSAAYRESHVGRLLSLEEARACTETSPSYAVEWNVCERIGSRSVRVFAQLWSEARALGAAELGLSADQVTAVRVADAVRLSGKGVA